MWFVRLWFDCEAQFVVFFFDVVGEEVEALVVVL